MKLERKPFVIDAAIGLRYSTGTERTSIARAVSANCNFVSRSCRSTPTQRRSVMEAFLACPGAIWQVPHIIAPPKV